MSQLTKAAIINAFIKILKDKPFEKITINDITDECGISRMTFYYHFEDIYDMVDYAIKEKLEKAISGDFSYETWHQDCTAVLEAILKEKAFFVKIFSVIDLRRVELYLSDFARKYVLEIIDEQSVRYGIVLNKDSREMVCGIYSYSVIGVLLNWIATGMKEEPSVLSNRFVSITKGTLKVILANAAENNNT
jgi:probable dihydroxyacetone kinase regulator